MNSRRTMNWKSQLTPLLFNLYQKNASSFQSLLLQDWCELKKNSGNFLRIPTKKIFRNSLQTPSSNASFKKCWQGNFFSWKHQALIFRFWFLFTTFERSSSLIMKRRIVTLLFFPVFFFTGNSIAQQLSGVIRDTKNQWTHHRRHRGVLKGTTTGCHYWFGWKSLNSARTQPLPVTIIVSFVGYEPQEIKSDKYWKKQLQ